MARQIIPEGEVVNGSDFRLQGGHYRRVLIGLWSDHGGSGVWTEPVKLIHINCLEFLATSLALKHFLLQIKGCHVLARSDSTTVVSYKYRHGGICSRNLHALTRRVLLWNMKHLLSLRAADVLGIVNIGADLLSRGDHLPGEWRLHPEVVQEVLDKYGQADVYLFDSDENTQCPLFFSLKETVASRDGCISTSLARDPVKCLPTFKPHPPHL